MEPDFSGWATKAGLKCSDGRTIMPGAFQHQDSEQVPLVWQHGHTDPENVLGHVILEHRDEGVYAYGYFNDSKKAQAAKEAIRHKDINAMSIWANELIEKAKNVLHGAIREVSLVLKGANPGALIEHVSIRHADGDLEEVPDEAIIYTGLELEHAAPTTTTSTKKDEGGDGDETVEDVFNSMTDKQKKVVHFMLSQAVADAVGGDLSQSDVLDEELNADDVYKSMTDQQKEFMHHMIDEALKGVSTETPESDGKAQEMKHNVFEKDGKQTTELKHTVSAEDKAKILEHAMSPGNTLKSAIEAYAEEHLEHGIEDIDLLFPEARTITNTPEFFGRRVEWVNSLLSAVRKSPFSRIKTLSADITAPEARAKGYITGTLKKEEFFKVARRVTEPQTIYKKQKLDRDDIIDITDFDVVVWLKGEMRIMLDEELARAILVGDGRAADHPDKIMEDKIRPVAFDHEVYTTQVNVEDDGTPGQVQGMIDDIVMNRSKLRGSGNPTMYISERYIARIMLHKDSLGRRIYKTLDEFRDEIRVKEIVSVEVLEEYPDIIAVIFNPMDYVVGATAGGQVSMFDDFDIDYNQYKYLIETRCSGALVKLKSAMVLNRVDVTSNEITPAEPAFNPETGAITITDQAGVVYRNGETDAVMNAAGSPYTVADGESLLVRAEPAAGYHFPTSDEDEWVFTNEA